VRSRTEWQDRGVQIRIEGSDLPGRSCGAAPGFPGYENIHVGVQRRNRPGELLEMIPGDAPSAVWSLDCDVVTARDGIDCKGPYIQGRPHERFIYLSWGAVDGAGAFNMFRRAKIWLDGADPKTVAAAQRSGTLVARLGLTDAKGHPVCASVRPPLVEWAAG
jgi:hypothetical protein